VICLEYKDLREKIKDCISIKDDNHFIEYAIVNNCSFLLEDSYTFIQNGKLSFAYPIMRQVYEYLFILFAFDNKQTTINDFAKENSDDRYVSNLKKAVYQRALETNSMKDYSRFKSIMDGLWTTLCERTHANFDRLLIQAYEYDSTLSQNDNLKLEAIIAHRLLEAFFWVTAEHLMDSNKKRDYSIFSGKRPRYDSKIKIPKSDTGIVERLLEIPNVKSVFSKRILKMRDEYIEIKPQIDELIKDEEVGED